MKVERVSKQIDKAKLVGRMFRDYTGVIVSVALNRWNAGLTFVTSLRGNYKDIEWRLLILKLAGLRLSLLNRGDHKVWTVHLHVVRASGCDHTVIAQVPSHHSWLELAPLARGPAASI